MCVVRDYEGSGGRGHTAINLVVSPVSHDRLMNVMISLRSLLTVCVQYHGPLTDLAASALSLSLSSFRFGRTFGIGGWVGRWGVKVGGSFLGHKI